MDHSLHFPKNFKEEIQKVILAINDRIRDGKFQYDIHAEAAKISALSSGKLDKYIYLRDEQTRFNYSTLTIAFEKENKTTEE